MTINKLVEILQKYIEEGKGDYPVCYTNYDHKCNVDCVMDKHTYAEVF